MGLPELQAAEQAVSLAGPPPIFLHSSFRTGSTWLWQKLRDSPTTLAYNEIFNEALAKLTPAKARSLDFAAWDSRHPPAAPYFLEFLPFIRPDGGVSKFVESSPFGTFIPAGGIAGELTPEEKAYIDQLLSIGRLQNRISVLSCTRTLGRARAFRHAFGGRTIFLHRNLFRQWASYCWQEQMGAPHFIASIRQTICDATHDPFLQSVASWYDLNHPSLPRQELFEAFIILHLYLYSIAFDAADLIVDTTQIANDRVARRQVERELSEMICHPIDLADARDHCEYTKLVVESSAKMRDTIEQFAKLIPTGMVSSEGQLFVERAKQRALTEWEQFEFFTKRTRAVYDWRINDASERLRQHAAEIDSLKAECHRLGAELLETRLARQAEETSARDLTAECATPRPVESAEVDDQALCRSTEAEKEETKRQLTTLEIERHDVSQRLAQAEAQRGAVTTCLSEALAREEELRTKLAKAQVDYEELERSMSADRRRREISIFLGLCVDHCGQR